MKIEIEKGDIIKASVQWLFFCVMNMDITMRLTNQILKLQKESDEEFSGSFLFLKLRLNTFETKYSNAHGKVQYLAEAKMPFSTTNSQTVVYLEYKLSDQNNSMLTLKCVFQTRGIMMGIYFPLIKCRIDAFLRKLFVNYERASNLIERNDEVLLKRLTESQLERINEHRNFYSNTFNVRSDEDPKVKVKDLEQIIMNLAKKVEILSEELKLGLRYRKTDPAASLSKARIALETLLVNLYRRLMKEEPKRYEPGYLLKINQFTIKIPRRIRSRMNTVRELGNLGSHPENENNPKEGSFEEEHKEVATPQDANDALLALSVIIEWYAKEFECPEIDNTPEGQFKEFCKKFYLTGIPDSNERKQIEICRNNFGLSVEKAEEIETEVIPAGILALKGAIELAYADDRMNEKETKKIFKMGKKHKISTEIARQLIEEYEVIYETTFADQYTELCKKFYYCEDGSITVPTEEQRHNMLRVQQSLGIPGFEANRIEEEVMHRSLLKLKVAIEQSFFDGMINENERIALESMADKYQIRQDIAERLIKECSKRMENCIKTQFLSFVEQFYHDAIPTSKQREQIEKKRLELRLSVEIAKTIEESCVSVVIDKYRAAVEGVYADGVVENIERAFLAKKAKELGVSEEIACQIEEVVRKSLVLPTDRASVTSANDFECEKSSIDKYEAICRGVYADNVLNEEEETMLQNARVELNISEEKAKQIESRFINQYTKYHSDIAIEKFRMVLEGVYADGKVDDKERKYIDKKITELGLSQDLADKIEKQFRETKGD